MKIGLNRLVVRASNRGGLTARQWETLRVIAEWRAKMVGEKRTGVAGLRGLATL